MPKLPPREVPSDLEIAQAHMKSGKMKKAMDLAKEIGFKEEEVELYGHYKAKIDFMKVLDRLKDEPEGKLIDVTAITPTPLGEGKTVTSIGMTEALNYYLREVKGKKGERDRCFVCLREPSMGPVFGIKGGAAGGGYSQVVPMEDLNLHFTGDIHAVSIAHNLCAAYLDNRIRLNELDIDIFNIPWRRVVDVNDRALRNIVIGLGGKLDGVPRESGFDISVASEVMAILALATDLKDLRERIGRIIVAYDKSGKPITAEDVGVAGAMTVLMKDALKPNLIQTLEGNPAFIHAGPFANIAHGNSSIIADKVAVKMADYVITESGFAADLGMEKFMDIKCRYSGIIPRCVILTCTVRALTMHGFPNEKLIGLNAQQLVKLIKEEGDLKTLEKGCANLAKHIENAKYFGVPVVVTINRFKDDTDEQHEVIRKVALEAGAHACYPIEVWMHGGKGAVEAAEAVIDAADNFDPKNFKFLYPLEAPIKEKIETIATKMYNADGVDYSPLAEQKIELYTKQGLDKLPICMAKTHLSISHEPTWKGVPSGYRLPIRDIRPSAGAGFLYPLCGEMRTMPGLGKTPAGYNVDIDVETGEIKGLF